MLAENGILCKMLKHLQQEVAKQSFGLRNCFKGTTSGQSYENYDCNLQV